MVTAHRQKAPDKHEVCRKVATLLKKAYAGVPPKRELPVLETLLYAICLENIPPAQADTVYARLLNAFHDLNEVRVSSISELQPVFVDVEDSDWRALRVKSSLQYIFEAQYSFDYEGLKRKTADLAAKQLAKIQSLSSFVRSYVLQHCLGSHILPIDSRMHAALVWLGLAEPGSTPEQAAEALRSYVRKADAPAFCHYLHCLATDPKRMRTFAAALTKPPASDEDPAARLDQFLRRGDTGNRERPRKAASSQKSDRNADHSPRSSRSKVGTKKRG